MIDLRSDTVTRPGAAMRAAMAAAEVGDDVYGDDPTVNRLQSALAERLGFEAGLFCPTGTQSNLIALLTHCGRGDEYLVGDDAHTYRYEGGGAAVLGGIQPQPLRLDEAGRMDLDDLAAQIKPDDVHFPRTRLLCLENTHNGIPLETGYVEAAQALARRHGLACHLDGARMFNAAVAQGLAPARIARGYDSVSVCLSKGLGAPLGSVLCASGAFIAEAVRWRKTLGGGMRQAGVVAAAGLYALEHHVERLAQDHARAAHLAGSLQGLPGFQVRGTPSNMVFITPPAGAEAALTAFLAERGIAIGGRYTLRLVTHLDIDDADIERVIDAIRAFAHSKSSYSPDR